jgi:hypothetical protein
MVKATKYAIKIEKFEKKFTLKRQPKRHVIMSGGRAVEPPLILPSECGFVGYWCDPFDFRFAFLYLFLMV